jgi:hypothetical protein
MAYLISLVERKDMYTLFQSSATYLHKCSREMNVEQLFELVIPTPQAPKNASYHGDTDGCELIHIIQIEQETKSTTLQLYVARW